MTPTILLAFLAVVLAAAVVLVTYSLAGARVRRWRRGP